MACTIPARYKYETRIVSDCASERDPLVMSSVSSNTNPNDLSFVVYPEIHMLVTLDAPDASCFRRTISTISTQYIKRNISNEAIVPAYIFRVGRNLEEVLKIENAE